MSFSDLNTIFPNLLTVTKFLSVQVICVWDTTLCSTSQEDNWFVSLGLVGRDKLYNLPSYSNRDSYLCSTCPLYVLLNRKRHFTVLNFSSFQDDFTIEDFVGMSAPLLYKMFKSKTAYPLHAAIRNKREDIVFLYLMEFDSQVGLCCTILFSGSDWHLRMTIIALVLKSRTKVNSNQKYFACVQVWKVSPSCHAVVSTRDSQLHHEDCNVKWPKTDLFIDSEWQ